MLGSCSAAHDSTEEDMNLVTLLIVVALIIGAVRGYQLGLGQVVLPTAGLIGGFLLGVRLVPYGMQLVDQPLAKLAVAILGTAALATLGAAIGSAVARRFDHASDRLHLGPITRTLGAALQAAMVLVLAWLLASGLTTVTAYDLGKQVQSSPIIQALNATLPAPPDIVSRLRALIRPNGFPNVFLAGEPQPTPVTPGPPVDPAVILTAERSVVKVVGIGCGGLVEGSGFVVSPGVVVTNAHVVAGVHGLVVEDPTGKHEATVVHFDPDEDVAVLRVPSLRDPAIATDPDLVASGSSAAVLGHPGGGSLRANDAVILSETTAIGQNIYDQGTVRRHIYEVAATIEPGNSGGPLIGTDGRVIGIVFAKSVSQENVGYALVWGEVAPQVEASLASTAPVATGACSAG